MDKPENKSAAAAQAEGRGAEACAKLVKRTVVSTTKLAAKDGQPAREEIRTQRVPIKASEVVAHKDYGSYVVVVTRDGQKFDSREASDAAAEQAAEA